MKGRPFYAQHIFGWKYNYGKLFFDFFVLTWLTFSASRRPRRGFSVFSPWISQSFHFFCFLHSDCRRCSCVDRLNGFFPKKSDVVAYVSSENSKNHNFFLNKTEWSKLYVILNAFSEYYIIFSVWCIISLKVFGLNGLK